MGLNIHTIAKIPRELEKEWFIYILDYGPQDPVSQALRACFDEMADWASRSGNAVVAMGTTPTHFSDEVFSWHSIAGLEGDSVLPAIMISTINPHVFHGFDPKPSAYKPTDQVVVISLRDVVDGPANVYPFVRNLLKELKSGTRLTQLEKVKQTTKNKGITDRLSRALQLKPSISGVGIDIKELLK